MAQGTGHREHIESALIEAHHLANLTGLDAARLARRRLVSAQSAADREATRDHLQEAIEYLELARMERRDAAAGFRKARRSAVAADDALAPPAPLQVHTIDRLLDADPETTERPSLAELRREAAVNSFQQLRYDVVLDQVFRELRRFAVEGEPPGETGTDDTTAGDLSPERALLLAAIEVEIAHRKQGPLGRDASFEFLSAENLVPTGD